MVMKYKWILFGVGSVVAVVLCWVFGVFICYDRIELTVRVGKVTDIFQPDASSSKVVLLKIKSSGNLRIDWGDGVVDDVVIDSCKHTYEDDGNYNISIRGENISHFTAWKVGMEKLKLTHCPFLEQLFCYDNYLEELDLSGCHLLKVVNCGKNRLIELDFSFCPALNYLYCPENHLISLNLSNNENLSTLVCRFNQLKTLNVDKCRCLTILDCLYNDLTSLNVKDCPLLQNLTCAENRLKVLELPAEASLTNLNCNCNELKELYLKSITLLKL